MQYFGPKMDLIKSQNICINLNGLVRLGVSINFFGRHYGTLKYFFINFRHAKADQKNFCCFLLNKKILPLVLKKQRKILSVLAQKWTLLKIKIYV